MNGSKKINSEPPETADCYRTNYAAGIHAFIHSQNEAAKKTRSRFMSPAEFPQKIDAYRAQFLKLLGITNLPEENEPQLKQAYISSAVNAVLGSVEKALLC